MAKQAAFVPEPHQHSKEKRPVRHVPLVCTEPVFSCCGSSRRDVKPHCPHMTGIIKEQPPSSDSGAALAALLISLTLAASLSLSASLLRFAASQHFLSSALRLRCFGLRTVWLEDVVFEWHCLSARLCGMRVCAFVRMWGRVCANM